MRDNDLNEEEQGFGLLVVFILQNAGGRLDIALSGICKDLV